MAKKKFFSAKLILKPKSTLQITTINKNDNETIHKVTQVQCSRPLWNLHVNQYRVFKVPRKGETWYSDKVAKEGSCKVIGLEVGCHQKRADCLGGMLQHQLTMDPQVVQVAPIVVHPRQIKSACFSSVWRQFMQRTSLKECYKKKCNLQNTLVEDIIHKKQNIDLSCIVTLDLSIINLLKFYLSK